MSVSVVPVARVVVSNSCSASALSSQRACREAAMMEAERRRMWEARVRRKERSAVVGV